eukprot:11170194-Lingulodinium_polyedra.AAC.1
MAQVARWHRLDRVCALHVGASSDVAGPFGRLVLTAGPRHALPPVQRVQRGSPGEAAGGGAAGELRGPVPHRVAMA